MALRGIMRTMTASPARELGPRMPQRKYMQSMMPSGLVQAMLRKGTRSMNLWASSDIRLVVSPTEIQSSHWSSFYIAALSLVESYAVSKYFNGDYAIKNHIKAPKTPH